MRTNIRLHRFTLILTFFVFCSSLQGFAGDVSLAWDPSISQGVIGYKVYSGPSPGNYSTSVEIGNQTTYTWLDLPVGTYYFAVTARDGQGNESGYSNEVSAAVTPPDTTPPVISSVNSSGVTISGATISWTTNEASTTQVEYGPTAGYGSMTSLNSSLLTSHSVSLSGLTPGTEYHYRVLSRDEAGNLATSGDFTFTTVALPQSPTNLRIIP